MPRKPKSAEAIHAAYSRRDRRPVERFVAGHPPRNIILSTTADVDDGDEGCPHSPASAAFGEHLVPDDVFADLLDRAQEAP